MAGLALAAGCGGSIGEPATPTDSVGTAVQEVDAAEARIGAALGGKSAQFGTPPPQVGAQIQGPKPDPAGQPSSEPPHEQPTTLDSQEEQCRVACDALTSMLRAVDRLCTITGQTDERCQSRRARADSASTRVVQACPSCNV
ncbi:MAG: hypothetical protein U0414_34670 [Polyangiaceae bacterium]